MAFGETSQVGAGAVLDIQERGVHLLPSAAAPLACQRLLALLKENRRYDSTLFLSEAEFDQDPQFRGVNPRPGRNLLERFAGELAFVEEAPAIVAALGELLGADYEIIDRKVVCGVPIGAVPSWLKARIAGNPVNNLGPYVRPEYRDVTYFYGIDFHQDLIDFKGRDADFVTLYVYLHPVAERDAPLFLLEGSHALGASVFPHDLKQSGAERWIYRNGPVGEVEVHQRVLTGGAGFAAVWHACALHGTQPDAADHERISLRYLIGKGSREKAGIDRINEKLIGPIRLDATRIDLDASGAAQIKRNTVLEA